jgi:nicotinate dehydrogenase subunit B
MMRMPNRRTFLAAGTSALAVVATPGGFRALAAAERSADPNLARLTTWLRVGTDGTADVFTGKVEIGMGTITGLAQIVAEELDVPLTAIRMTTGDTATTPDQGGVGGSTSTQLGARPLRHAAAEARRVLVAAAAQRLGVPADRLDVRDGIVHDRDDAARSVPYGTLVAALADAPALAVSGEAFGLDVAGAAKPKDPAAYRIVGTPVARLDVSPKIYGTFRYVVDVKLPGMVHARVVRPPSVGARPLAIDAEPLRAHGDARLVRVGDLLAVLASREWDAVAGARDLRIRWSGPSTTFPPHESLAAAMWAMPASSRDRVVARNDVNAASAGAQIVEASYAWPFQSHATMGPGCAVADVRPSSVTIWCGAQKPHALREGIADLLDVPAAHVRVVFAEDAGSYGRAGFDDAAADAALLSRAVGKPVRVQWMRADMTTWGPKAPAIVGRLRGALRDGKIAALDLTIRAFNGGEISSHPDSAGNFLGGQLAGHANTKPRVEYALYGKNSAAYEIPALHALAELVAPLAPSISPLRTTHLRDPEGPGTTFIVESFIDELAAQAQADPVAFRVAHLRDSRAIGVLHKAAETAGWTPGHAARNVTRSGTARGRGVAFATRGDTMVATIADVEVDLANGKVRVTRLVCAHDCGTIVNPRSIRGTIEANLMQSMSRALYEEVRFEGGTVTSRDWATYPVVRTVDLPERVDVVLVEHHDLPPYGAGEPSSRPTAAAIANAIHDATGARVRTAPFTPANVLAALRG